MSDKSTNKDTSSSSAPKTGEKTGEVTLIDRVKGGLIDGLLFAIPATLISMILPASIGSILGLIINLAGIAYILLRDALPQLDGISIGKKITGTRAVREDGSPLTGDFKTSALRNVWMLISPVELVVLFIRQGKPDAGRRLGDDTAKTKVVYT